jgi:hypothetical protein
MPSTASDLQIPPAQVGERIVVLAVDFEQYQATVLAVDPSDPNWLTVSVDVQTNLGASWLVGLEYGPYKFSRPGWARPADLAIDPKSFGDADPAAVARRKALGPQAGDVVLYTRHEDGEVQVEHVRVLDRAKDDPTRLTLQGQKGSYPGVGHGWGHCKWIWPDEERAEKRKLTPFQLSPSNWCAWCHEVPATVAMYLGYSNPLSPTPPAARLCAGCESRLRAFTSPENIEPQLSRVATTV